MLLLLKSISLLCILLRLLLSLLFHHAELRVDVEYSPTSIVDNLLNNTSNVSVALGVVVDTQLGRSLVVLGVSGEDTTALSLSSNDPTHG